MTRSLLPWTGVSLALLAAVAMPVRAESPVRITEADEDRAILGFNEGRAHRIHGAAAEVLLQSGDVSLYRFEDSDWMDRSGRGAFVALDEIAGRYPERGYAELVRVYRVPFGDADEPAELLLVPNAEVLAGEVRYAPTVVHPEPSGRYRPVWAARTLPGTRYRVADIRDLDGGDAPEILLTGEVGRSGHYRFHALVGRSARGFRTLDVRHVDEVRYRDLGRDGRIEVVIRKRLGREGAPHQWTYLEHLHRWTGEAFERVDAEFVRYHARETLPSLVGELVAQHDADRAVLREKVRAIRKMRARVREWADPPRRFEERLERALSARRDGRDEVAQRRLGELRAAYPYEARMLLALAELRADREAWEDVLRHAVRTLTLKPRERRAWWWLGVALLRLDERASARASFRNLVRLGGDRREAVAFLRSRRGQPGMEGRLQTLIDETLERVESG